MHAYALELLYPKLKDSKKVLDIGSGSGYLTLAMALLTPNGHCTGRAIFYFFKLYKFFDIYS